MLSKKGGPAGTSKRVLPSSLTSMSLQAPAELALTRRKPLLLVVFEADRDVAPLAVDTEDDGVAEGLGSAMFGKLDAARDVHALEVLLGDEVHHAGHRVRTVDRRIAAGQDLDAVEHRERDEVDVRLGRGAACTREAEPLAVHEDERALGAQRPQIDVGRADAARRRGLGRVRVARVRVDGVVDLRAGHQRRPLQQIRQIAHTQLDRFIGFDHLQGRGAGEGVAADARTRHHDLFQLLLLAGGLFALPLALDLLGESRTACERQRQQRCRRQQPRMTRLARRDGLGCHGLTSLSGFHCPARRRSGFAAPAGRAPRWEETLPPRDRAIGADDRARRSPRPDRSTIRGKSKRKRRRVREFP
ncbi:MAG: hypothetical protein KatS3mg119_0013 [Rhodothalassiaceae bacterium]|nr:MAG: hypothetical protein KatS3mg119_0013 [Rhodothalassiaceae bacterium]